MEVHQYEEQFIVMASDGLWEVMENKDVGKFMVPYFMKNDLEGGVE